MLKWSMKIQHYFLLVLLFCTFGQGAQAQEILNEPICFTVRNTAPHKVYGNFVTDYYTAEDGTQARHRSNFRLDEAGAKDPEKGFPLDAAEFCSYGPFFPERKLELVIRTLIPVFSCKTSVEKGEILIKSERLPDDSGNKIWAECFE
jgi:hypothetical protein